MLFGLYKAVFQEVGYAFDVVQGQLSGLGFQWLISGYSYEVVNVAERWTGCLAMNLYFRCAALLKTFGEDDIIIFTEEVGYLV